MCFAGLSPQRSCQALCRQHGPEGVLTSQSVNPLSMGDLRVKGRTSSPNNSLSSSNDRLPLRSVPFCNNSAPPGYLSIHTILFPGLPPAWAISFTAYCPMNSNILKTPATFMPSPRAPDGRDTTMKKGEENKVLEEKLGNLKERRHVPSKV